MTREHLRGCFARKVCQVAARDGASVVRETADPAIAYADVWARLPRSRFVNYRPGWLRD
jgi:hypothetical protein